MIGKIRGRAAALLAGVCGLLLGLVVGCGAPAAATPSGPGSQGQTYDMHGDTWDEACDGHGFRVFIVGGDRAIAAVADPNCQ